MYYYKEIKDEKVLSLQSCNKKLVTSDTFLSITKEEYEEISAQFKEKGEQELMEEIEKSKTEEMRYIEQLEAENASLLYQILTGEELENV